MLRSRLCRTVLLATVLGAPLACTTVVRPGERLHDRDRDDYHVWNEGEERAYRAYLAERHREYVDYHRLNRHDQADYWHWRHDHPDRR